MWAYTTAFMIGFCIGVWRVEIWRAIKEAVDKS